MKRSALVYCRRAILLLAAGAVVSMVIGWGLTLRLPPPMTLADARGESSAPRTLIGQRTGVLTISQGEIATPSSTLIGAILDEQAYQELVPAWSAFSNREPIESAKHLLQPGDTSIWYTEHSAGWPLLAHRCVYVRRYGWSPTGGGSVVVASRTGVPLPESWIASDRVSLPVRPIWLNLLVNSALYGSILGLVIWGPGTIRRFARMRRGACAACGYPLGQGAVCSECGAAVPAAHDR